jgi:hypothetical protein
LFFLSCKSSYNWEEHFYQQALKAIEDGRNYDYFFYSNEIKRNGFQYVDEIETLEVTPEDDTLLSSNFFYKVPYGIPSSIQNPYTIIIDDVTITRANFYEIVQQIQDYGLSIPKNLRFNLDVNFPPNFTPSINRIHFENFEFKDFNGFGGEDFGEAPFGETPRFNKQINTNKCTVHEDHTLSISANKISVGNLIDMILEAYDLVITTKNGQYFFEPKYITKIYKSPIDLQPKDFKRYIDIISGGDKDFKIVSNDEVFIKYNSHCYSNDLVPFDNISRKFEYEIWSSKGSPPYSRIEIEKSPDQFQIISSEIHNINFESSFETSLFSLKYGAKKDSFVYTVEINENIKEITRFPCDLIYQLPDNKFLLLKLR